jgi:hypothetical protein
MNEQEIREMTIFQNLFLAIGAIGIFGFYDYVGFNTVCLHLPTVRWWIYRVSQFVLFVGLCVGLYSLNGWMPMIGFIVLHQTWWADLLYYLLYDTLRWYGGDYAGIAFSRGVMNNKVTWAWWTPYGIAARWIPGKKEIPIAGKTLVWQAVIGMVVVILIAAVTKQGGAQ